MATLAARFRSRRKVFLIGIGVLVAVVGLVVLDDYAQRDPYALHEAAIRGDLAAVHKELLRTPQAINTLGPRGFLEFYPNPRTPLALAAENGHLDVVEELLRAGSDVNARDRFGRSVLIAAIAQEHREVVGALLNAGADANLQANYGTTPLLEALSLSNDDILRLLLAAGADASSALLGAYSRNDVALARRLIKAGAKPDTALLQQISQDTTPNGAVFQQIIIETKATR